MKKKKGMRFEIKEISDLGTFEGILSPYGNVDDGGDVVLPGAYTKTLKEQGATRPLLWQHKTDTPIGLLTLEDREDGLWCKGELLMELPEAKKAYLLIKAKIVRGLSIGFDAIKELLDGAVRKLAEIKLYEGSIVTFPMNEAALITSVKGRGETKGDFNEELTERQLSDAGYQMRNALSDALYSAFWSGLPKADVISLSEMIIDQFRDAYMAYLPNYVDMMTEYYGDMETWHAHRFETKEGKRISAATKETLSTAHSHMKSALDLISALCDDEADDDDDIEDTSESKAAPAPGNAEPVIDHSAVATSINALREATKWN